MLKHKAEQISVAVKILDLFICLIAFAGAYFFRSAVATQFHDSFWHVGTIGDLSSISWLLAASLIIHLAIYPYLGFYESIRQKTITALIFMITKAFVCEFFVLGTMVFLLQEKGTSRYLFLIFLALNYFLILSSRLSAWVILSASRNKGYNFRQILIVGTGQNALNVKNAIEANPRWGFVICGFLSTGRDADSCLLPPDSVISSMQNLEMVVKGRAVDEVIFALDYLDGTLLADRNALCHSLGIPARFSLSFFDEPDVSVKMNVTEGIPFLSLYRTSKSPFESLFKRSIDIFSAITGLLIAAFLFPFVALKIKSQSPGPIIFSQPRVGENGRIFRCYKFRTMRVDAEKILSELAEKNEMSGAMFKVKSDPRIFPFGAFLRKTSLDELPQFWNVLKGEMSLVGTRPPLIDEVKQYEIQQRRRLSIKPGMTGLWQISGRNKINRFEDVVALDLKYIDNWSIWLDVKIILKTIRVVWQREGS